MKNYIRVSSFFSVNSYKSLFILLLVFFSQTILSAGGGLELTGNITALGTDYFVIQGYKIFVDSNTDLRGTSNDPVNFSYFQVNDLIEVKADAKSDGTYLAVRVKFDKRESGEDKNKIVLSGYVTKVDTNSFVINGVTILTNATTQFKGRKGKSFSIQQIQAGMLLEVEASLQTGGTFLASRIRTDDDNHPHADGVELTGVIDSISANSIYLEKIKIVADGQTVILNDHNLPVAFSNLIKGERVEINAVKQPDNTYLATSIRLEDLPENEFEFTAKIDNIAPGKLTAGGITFTTDSNTVFLDNNNLTITLVGLSAGMWVDIKGSKTPGAVYYSFSYYAAVIKIEDFVRTEIEIKGIISGLTGSSFVVNGITFSTDSSTVVLDHLNHKVEYSALKDSMLVEANGIQTGTATAIAHIIKIEGEDDIEIVGNLTAVNSSSIELNGLVISVNENTAYLNQANLAITLSAMSVNQFVEVKMIKNPDSTFTALRIKIEDGTNLIKVTGTAGTVSGSSIQLATGSYIINSATMVIDNNFNPISSGQLAGGQQVIIWASAGASAAQTAIQIQALSAITATEVNQNPAVVSSFNLNQNYPNPFNPSTIISFTTNNDLPVTLKVYNSIGEEVRVLVNGNLSKGLHIINFDARGLSSGIYYYRLKSGDQAQVKKMLLLK